MNKMLLSLCLLLILFIPSTLANDESGTYMPSYSSWVTQAISLIYPTLGLASSPFQSQDKDWLSYPISDSALDIQKKSSESPTVVRLDDLLHEEKKQQQYDIQETILDLIVGVFILLLDIIIIVYYIIELWFFMKLFTDWLPGLFRKMAESTGNFIVKMRSKR